MRAKTATTFFYGWWVVIAALIIGTIIFGTRYSFGVFFKSIETDFNLSRTMTSAIFSVYMIVGSGFELLGGWSLDRYGPRIVILCMGVFTGVALVFTGLSTSPWQLFVTYSLLLAAGTGAAYSVLMATVSRWFRKKRGMALGIGGAGAGLGVVIVAPTAAYLISQFEWRTAYIVIGIVAFVLIVLSSRWLRKEPAEMGLLPDGANAPTVAQSPQPTGAAGLSLAQAWRTRSFWLLGMIWFLWAVCLHLTLTHLVPRAVDLQISNTDAARVLATIGAISIPGRLMMGALSDRIGKRQSAVICASAMGAAMLWLPAAGDLAGLYLFALVFGLAYGGLDPPTTALMSDAFGLRNLGIIMAALHLGWGVGAAIGPALGGLIFDATGAYSVAFVIGGIAMFMAGVCALLARSEKQRLGERLRP